MKYKVGDKVRIKSRKWYNENKDEFGNVGYFTSKMTQFCGRTVTIIDVDEVQNIYTTVLEKDYLSTENAEVMQLNDEMIEGLVEDECPQDFIEEYCKSCGTQRCDRTKEYLNGCPYYNVYRCKKQNNTMEEKTKSEPKFKVGDRVKWYNHTCNITSIDTNENTHIYLIKHDDYREDKIFAKWVPENELTLEDDEETKPNIIEEAKTCWDSIKDAWICPEGYQFKDENGNVINAQKIVLEKKLDDKLKLESTKKVREYWSEYARIFIEIYDDDPNKCIFTHLWVVDGQRQKGYGKQALIQAEEIAKELGCHVAHLKVETNSWMHNWYSRCGYQWYKNANEGYTWLTKNL